MGAERLRPRHDVAVYLREIPEPVCITGLDDTLAYQIRDELTGRARWGRRFFEFDHRGKQYRFRYRDVATVVLDLTPPRNPFADEEPMPQFDIDGRLWVPPSGYGEFS